MLKNPQRLCLSQTKFGVSHPDDTTSLALSQIIERKGEQERYSKIWRPQGQNLKKKLLLPVFKGKSA
jgi:hypothetical protein